VPLRFLLPARLATHGVCDRDSGHISPLGAYDGDTDKFLILDVARYKYPPVWVKAAVLFGAMNTADSDNNNRTRGYVLIELSQ